jgi:hypothetical protein
MRFDFFSFDWNSAHRANQRLIDGLKGIGEALAAVFPAIPQWEKNQKHEEYRKRCNYWC